MVDGMSVVVNVMLSRMSVMSPVQPIVAHCCEVMYFGCFGFRGELGFLNCYDICMCVVNKQTRGARFLYKKNLLQEIQLKHITHLYNIYNLPFSID